MTVNYVIGTPRQDKRMRISLILTIGNTKKRIHTDFLVTRNDLNRQGKLQRDSPIYNKVKELIRKTEREMESLEIFNTGEKITATDALHRIRKAQIPSFFTFAEEWIRKTEIKGWRNYQCSIRKFREFLKGRDIQFSEFSYSTFDDFYHFIKDDIRTYWSYLGAIKVIYQDAEKRYDIPAYYSFHYRIPRRLKTEHRAIDKDILKRIFLYDGNGERAIIARDCCILSFCFAGTNSADLYAAPPIKNNTLAYDRAKTKDRRFDNAHIEFSIPPQIKELVRKYKGKTKAFNFYQRYSTPEKFNSCINIGLKTIQKAIENETKTNMPPLTFYAIRHTYATIARNEVGIDKSTIHELLNHIERETAIDDIYIKKDFRIIDDANRKVVDYVFKILALL